MNYEQYKSTILSIVNEYTVAEGDDKHRINFIRLIFPGTGEKIDFAQPIYFKDGLVEAIKEFLFKQKGYNIRIAYYGRLFYKPKIKKLCVGLHYTDAI